MKQTIQAALIELQKLADIELVLTNIRQERGTGFIDTLILDLSERFKKSPQARRAANSLLQLSGYRQYKTDLLYVSADRINDEDIPTKFFKAHNGELYATGQEEVLASAKDIFIKADGIMNSPYSLVFNMCIDGLDYFEGMSVMKHKGIYKIEQKHELGQSFYSTIEGDAAETLDSIIRCIKQK